MNLKERHKMAITDKHSIIVDIPKPENIVFIAMPFSKDFRNVQTAIEAAVNRCPEKLTPCLTKTIPQSPSFIKDITTLTQTARLVVAVCSPEKATGVPNPNVMYELGLAQSIGKATIIMTNDVDSLPTDLKDQNVLVYNPANARKEEFIADIKIHINDVLVRVRHELIDSSYEKISVAHARHWLLVNPDLWDQFITVLSFAKQTHNLFQELDTGLVDYMPKRLSEILGGSYKGKALKNKKMDFEDLWRDYINKYEKIEADSLLDENRSKVDDAFDVLKEHPSTGDMFKRSKKFYEALNVYMDTYNKTHLATLNYTEKGIVNLLNGASASDFRSSLSELSANLKAIMLHADRLMLNVINVILKDSWLP